MGKEIVRHRYRSRSVSFLCRFSGVAVDVCIQYAYAGSTFFRLPTDRHRDAKQDPVALIDTNSVERVKHVRWKHYYLRRFFLLRNHAAPNFLVWTQMRWVGWTHSTTTASSSLSLLYISLGLILLQFFSNGRMSHNMLLSSIVWHFGISISTSHAKQKSLNGTKMVLIDQTPTSKLSLSLLQWQHCLCVHLLCGHYVRVI